MIPSGETVPDYTVSGTDDSFNKHAGHHKD